MPHEYQFTLVSARLKLRAVTSTSPYVRFCIGTRRYYRSAILLGTNPEWNEVFTITNVRDTDVLRVEVWNDRVKDRLIGSSEISLNSELYLNAEDQDEDGVLCKGLIGKQRLSKHVHHRKQYVFVKIKYLEELPEPLGDFPVYSYYPRFEIHNPVASGILESILPRKEDFDHYITNTLYMSYVDTCFKGKKQPWCRTYGAAQTIFSESPKGKAIRLLIRAQYTALFSNNHNRDKYFTCESTNDFFKVIYTQEGHPRMFTYSIIYDGMRFTETGVKFFRNFLSKHTMLALGAEEVYYSGEFHVRVDDDGVPVLVIDNNSGTYAPDKNDLPKLKELFAVNFPDMRVETRDREDPRTKEFTKHYQLNRHLPFFKLMQKRQERSARKEKYKQVHEAQERREKEKEERKKEKKKVHEEKKENAKLAQEEGGEGEEEGGEEEEYAEDYMDVGDGGETDREEESDEEGLNSEEKKKEKEEKEKEEEENLVKKDRDDTTILKKIELLGEL